MIYAVIDTNVIISGIINHLGAPGKIVDLIYDGSIIPILTEEIFNEVERVINYSKFSFILMKEKKF